MCVCVYVCVGVGVWVCGCVGVGGWVGVCLQSMLVSRETIKSAKKALKFR